MAWRRPAGRHAPGTHCQHPRPGPLLSPIAEDYLCTCIWVWWCLNHVLTQWEKRILAEERLHHQGRLGKDARLLPVGLQDDGSTAQHNTGKKYLPNHLKLFFLDFYILWLTPT